MLTSGKRNAGTFCQESACKRQPLFVLLFVGLQKGGRLPGRVPATLLLNRKEKNNFANKSVFLAQLVHWFFLDYVESEKGMNL